MALNGLLSFLKTSSAAENLAFQPTAGYRLQGIDTLSGWPLRAGVATVPE